VDQLDWRINQDTTLKNLRH